MYIQIGSNTNGGEPGQLTGDQIQKENYYSAATIVAYMGDPLFDGTITYDATDDGTPNGGHGIEVFAPGNRNPFGITLRTSRKPMRCLSLLMCFFLTLIHFLLALIDRFERLSLRYKQRPKPGIRGHVKRL
jgi:hypothetical protein